LLHPVLLDGQNVLWVLRNNNNKLYSKLFKENKINNHYPSGTTIYIQYVHSNHNIYLVHLVVATLMSWLNFLASTFIHLGPLGRHQLISDLFQPDNFIGLFSLPALRGVVWPPSQESSCGSEDFKIPYFNHLPPQIDVQHMGFCPLRGQTV
jgi:hypothetical protein